MPVLVIIVAYNSGPLLVECVRAVLASSVPVRVVISDNGSDDCSLAGVDQLAGADARLNVMRNHGNIGFAAANNRALGFAEADYVLFLNPDCIVGRDTLEIVSAALDARPAAGMAGCVIRNPDGSEQAGCRRHLPTPRRLVAAAFALADMSRTDEPAPRDAAEVEAISGAFMMVRKEALDRIGSFDEGYFMHWEDLDLCQRFHAAGSQILFVPDAEVVHFKGRSSRRRPVRVEWYKHTGMARYLRKFHYAHWPRAVFALASLPIWLRFLVKLGIARFAPAEPAASLAGQGNAADAEEVWVFGASSPIGCCLLPRLLAAGYRVRAFSRNPAGHGVGAGPMLRWEKLDVSGAVNIEHAVSPVGVIHLAPLDLLPRQIDNLIGSGMRRLIAFGTTSIYTKRDGSKAERDLVERLTQAERVIESRCAAAGTQWAIFRPTIIYGSPRVGGIALLSRFARHFGFLPIVGKAAGLRQPVHADDLAKACLSLMATAQGWNRAYDLGGGEVLRYRDMLARILRKLHRQPRIIRVPELGFRLILALVRLYPAYRHLSYQIGKRMERNMVFDCSSAQEAFGYHPRPFEP